MMSLFKSNRIVEGFEYRHGLKISKKFIDFADVQLTKLFSEKTNLTVNARISLIDAPDYERAIYAPDNANYISTPQT